MYTHNQSPFVSCEVLDDCMQKQGATTLHISSWAVAGPVWGEAAPKRQTQSTQDPQGSKGPNNNVLGLRIVVP